MNLDELPLELILNILRSLSVDDILVLRLTSKALCYLTHERSVWFDALYTHLVLKGLPIPGLQERNVSSLSAAQLENLTLRALRYRRNWTSSTPVHRYEIEVFPINIPGGARPRCMAVHFLPGRESNWIVSLILQDQRSSHRTYMIQCWDISLPQPRCLALFSTTGLLSVVINAETTHPAVLSITRQTRSRFLEHDGLRTTTTFAIDPTAKDPENGFRGLISFASPRNAIALCGSSFFGVDAFDHVHVYDVDTGQLLYILRAPSLYDDTTVRSEEFRCIKVLSRDGFIMTFCQQWIHLYNLSDSDKQDGFTDTKIRELHPVANYKWPYRIDRLDVLVQPDHPLCDKFYERGVKSPKSHPKPICILVRFDSWFPWPVNILHQFVLPPNPSYCPTQERGTSTIQDESHKLPYFLDTASDKYAPYLVASIPSPVRLFTSSDMVLGEYGTALWLDAQTATSSAFQVGDRGQRIAGQAVQFRRNTGPNGESHFPRHPVDLEAEQDSETGDPEDLVIGEPDSPVTRLVAYHIDESNENWSRLAISDQEGKIAAGCNDGRIVVYGYA